jgi:hypothetical protein
VKDKSSATLSRLRIKSSILGSDSRRITDQTKKRENSACFADRASDSTTNSEEVAAETRTIVYYMDVTLD